MKNVKNFSKKTSERQIYRTGNRIYTFLFFFFYRGKVCVKLKTVEDFLRNQHIRYEFKPSNRRRPSMRLHTFRLKTSQIRDLGLYKKKGICRFALLYSSLFPNRCTVHTIHAKQAFEPTLHHTENIIYTPWGSDITVMKPKL